MMSHPFTALRRALRALTLGALALAVSAPALAQPTVHLEIENDVREITEGESFRYRIIRSDNSNHLTVNVNESYDASAQDNLRLTTQPGSPFGGNETFSWPPIGAGSGDLHSRWETVSIPENDSDVTGTNGTLTISISSHSAYELGNPHTWTITVQDNDDPPPEAIRINFRDTGLFDSLVEGSRVNFVLTASRAPSEEEGPLTINVWLSGGSGFGVTDGARPVTLEADATTATLPVDTDGDMVNQSGNLRGTLSAELRAGTGYVLGSGVNSSVQIRDDDYELTIEAATLSEAEGAEVLLTLRSDSDVADEFDATLSISWPEGFGLTGDDRNVTETVPFDINARNVAYTLTLLTNDILNEDATVAVAIVDSERYVLGTPSSVDITIQDDDEPPEDIVISIEAGDSPVVEGGNAIFTLSATRAPSEELTINVSLSGGGDFGVMDGTEEVPLETGTTTAVLTVPIPTDTENQSGNFRTLRATVETGTGYVPPDSTFFANAEVRIQDDDYELTIEVRVGPQVAESGEIRLAVVTDELMDVLPFDAAVSISWPPGFESMNEPRREFRIGGTAGGSPVTAQLISLTIPDNEVVNEDISVRVEILPGDHYELGDRPSVTVTFRDDDVRVSIAEAAPVTEGEEAVFTLSANPAPLTAFTVNVSLTGGAGFGLQNLSPTVAFRAGSSTALLMVPTRDDETHEANGVVTATLDPGLGYSVGATSSAMATILDDDVRVSIATAAPAAVAEGEAAVFTLTTSESPLSAFTVPVSWSGGSGFGVEAGERSFEFAVGSTTAVLTVPTQGDAVHKRDEAVTATLGSGPGYTVAAESSTMVTIRDDDVRVSIAAVSASVAEDDPAVFMLTASERPLTAFTVPVSWSGGAAFGVTAGERSLEFGVGSTTAVLTVPTTGDEAHELDEVVTATLGSGLGYSVGAQASAMTTIRDDEITVSIAASSSSVMEGEVAGFILTLSGTPAVAFTVPVSWLGGAGFGVEDGSRSFAFEVGSTTATLMLTTQDDLVDEANGVLTATLADGSGYEPGTSASATVTIENDDTSTPDVNADNMVNANDALILYYAYSLRGELGNGR